MSCEGPPKKNILVPIFSIYMGPRMLDILFIHYSGPYGHSLNSRGVVARTCPPCAIRRITNLEELQPEVERSVCCISVLLLQRDTSSTTAPSRPLRDNRRSFCRRHPCNSIEMLGCTGTDHNLAHYMRARTSGKDHRPVTHYARMRIRAIAVHAHSTTVFCIIFTDRPFLCNLRLRHKPRRCTPWKGSGCLAC